MFYKKILDLLDKNKFISFENLINYKGDFEEVDMILRMSDLSDFNLPIAKLNALIFNMAFFHMKNVKLFANDYLKKSELEQFFICLTVTEFDEGIIIPNFYVSTKNRMSFIYNNINKTFNNKMIEEVLKDAGLDNSFRIFNNSPSQKVKRIYIVENNIK